MKSPFFVIRVDFRRIGLWKKKATWDLAVFITWNAGFIAFYRD